SWILLKLGEARFEILQCRADGPGSGAAARGTTSESGFERERGGQAGSKCRRKFSQAFERHLANGFSVLSSGAQHLSHDFVCFAKGHAKSDQIIRDFSRDQRGILRRL